MPSISAIPTTTLARQPSTRAAFAVPVGACNCHVHTVGPIESFPQAAERPFTFGAAPVDQLIANLDHLGLDHVVILPSVTSGTDHSYMIAALRRLGSRGRALAVISRSAKARIAALHPRAVWRGRSIAKGILQKGCLCPA